MFVSRCCPACESVSGIRLFSLPITQGCVLELNEYRLINCKACDTLYIDPKPSAVDLTAMYGGIQFSSANYRDSNTISAIIKYLGNALSIIVNSYDLDEDFSVLEVGAGRAWMCLAARLNFPRSHTVAQDITSECATTSPWADKYEVGSIEQLFNGHEEKYFDLISLTHVIEHLADPSEQLRLLARKLSKKGTIFLTAPYRPSGFDPDKPDREEWLRWSYNHVPAHIQYFSEAGLGALARNCGLRLEKWDHRHDHGQAFEAWLRPL